MKINSITHKSDSLAQRTSEPVVLTQLNSDLNLTLQSQVINLPNGTSVQVDGFDEDMKTACEIYSRVGKLKGSQPDKLASDILKLILIERHLGGTWRKIICFVDTEAAKSLTNSSWLASTCKTFSIEVVTVAIPVNIRESLLRAQTVQDITINA